jgi:replicative superfamily II helicase
MRGSIDGDVTWPVFVPGAKYASAFPERAPVHVTADLASLAAAGFPQALITAPASSVIIAGLDHPGEEPYSVAEYKNLVGRAGRLGYTGKGTFILAGGGPAH